MRPENRARRCKEVRLHADAVVTRAIRDVRVIRGEIAELRRMPAITSADLFRACYGEPAVHS